MSVTQVKIMRPTSAKYTHDHGSASRRRSGFAMAKVSHKSSPVKTPAEKRAFDSQKTTKEVIQAA